MTLPRCIAFAGIGFYTLSLGLALIERTGPAILAIFLAILLPTALSGLRGRFTLQSVGPSLPASIAVGVGLRFAWAVYAQLQPVSDFEAFWNFAGQLPASPLDSLARSKSPGSVLYYAALRAAFGDGQYAVYAANALLGGVQILLVQRIAKPLIGESAAFSAAAVYAMFPSLILFSGIASSEAPFLCLMLAGTHCFLRPATDSQAIQRASLVSGSVAFAAAHLTRSVGVLVWLAALLVRAGRARRPLYTAAAGISLFTLLCVPQMLSNQRTYGWPVASPSVSGDLNLLFGTNREHRGWWNQDDIESIRALGSDETPAKIRNFMADARRVALGRIRADPLGFLGFALTVKFGDQWSTDRGGADWTYSSSPRLRTAEPGRPLRHKDLRRVSDVFYLMVCVGGLAACLGAVRERAAQERLVPLLLPVLFVAALHVLIEVQPRYHFVVLPHLTILAVARRSVQPPVGIAATAMPSGSRPATRARKRSSPGSENSTTTPPNELAT